MSTETKAGQEVVVTGDEGSYRHSLPAGTVATVKVVDGSPSTLVTSDGREVWVGNVDLEPAPLDPKSVHVGDTVTVRFKETGDEIVTKAYQPDDVTKPGEWVYLLGWPLHRPDGTFGLAFSYFEILAIEPAPAPEPEWKPGTVAEATVCGHPGHRVMRIDQDPDAPTGLLWADALGHRMAESVVTDVRPLVVIDPAAVDVDALVKVAHHDRVLYGDTTPDQMRRAILRILAHMGIEATS